MCDNGPTQDQITYLHELADAERQRWREHDSLIERGARVLHARNGFVPWERVTEPAREAYRADARAVLEAFLNSPTRVAPANGDCSDANESIPPSPDAAPYVAQDQGRP